MMKNTIKLLGIALITGLLLAGCYVPVNDGVGSVGIKLPDASSTGEASDQEIARIYLLNEIALVTIGETTPYKVVEIEQADNEVSIGPVPSGPGYQIILVLGNDAADPVAGGDATIFVPELYAVSDQFAVIAGQATLKELVPVTSPFGLVPVVFGENLKGIVNVQRGPTIPDDFLFYTASAGEAIELAHDLSATVRAALPDGEEAIGMGMGALVTEPTYGVPWVNTTKGILPYLGGTSLELGFRTDYPSDFPPVLDSGAFLSGGDLFGWFQVDGGLGGVYDNEVGAKQWVADIDLSTFISGQPISDLVVDSSTGGIDGYFASKLGAFKAPERILTENINTVQGILEASSFFEVAIDDEEATITELALVDTELYLGTNRGVVSVLKADLDLDSIPTSDVVTESIGRTVQDMAIGANYHAILTDHFLIVSSDGGPYSLLPIYAGIVTAPTGLFLDDSTGVVLIAGETGIASVDIDGP
ncbi:MAG: hypothetical protein KOO61_08425 [Spirochaetales bacterium]|nr:hypothetical protein [Spirochaetales bacterium]